MYLKKNHRTEQNVHLLTTFTTSSIILSRLVISRHFVRECTCNSFLISNFEYDAKSSRPNKITFFINKTVYKIISHNYVQMVVGNFYSA